MLNIRVIPCLLLKDKGLVKTVRFKDPRYIGDPINTVRIFNEKEVDELIVLDITASLENRSPDFVLIESIASETFMPFGYGGGIKTIDEAKRLFRLGVEKVIINSAAVLNPNLISDIVDIAGSQSVVVSLDVKKNIFGKYEVYIKGGSLNIKKDPVDLSKQMQKIGVGEIFINSIDKDGLMLGYDIDLIRKITSETNIPVVACGGAGKLSDFKKVVNEGGASAVAAGSFFVFHGKHRAVLITYPSIIELEGLFK